MLAEEMYKYECLRNSDINEHLPTLKRYADQCESIYELGVRRIVSTWAFLCGEKLNTLISVDLQNPNNFGGDINMVYHAADQLKKNFTFIQMSSLDVYVREVDMVFIDTLHIYDLCIEELKKYSKIAKKYIALHDTELFGINGETPNTKGLNFAIDEFLQNNDNWELAEKYTNNNGLTILRRK